MIPGGFEPPTFHLGGERSIQLSYGSLVISDFGIWIAECQGIGDPSFLRIISEQRLYVVAFELVAAIEEIQFDEEQ